jgi:hypothetical protein
MSVKALAWAFEKKIGDPYAKLILLALADFASDAGDCWPSTDTIADKSGCSQRSVFRKLDELAQLGLLKKTERFTDRGQTSNFYILNVNNLDPQAFEVGGDSLSYPPSPAVIPPMTLRSYRYEPSLEEESKNHIPLKEADSQDSSVDKKESKKERPFERKNPTDFFGNKRDARPQNENDLVLLDGKVFISSTTVEELGNDFPGLPNARGRIKAAAVGWLEAIEMPRRMSALRSHLANKEQESLDRAAAREQRNGILKDVLVERNKLKKADQEAKAAAQAERDKPKQPCW